MTTKTFVCKRCKKPFEGIVHPLHDNRYCLRCEDVMWCECIGRSDLVENSLDWKERS